MKQTLLSIRRTTNITTQAIAEKAHLEIADVYTVEVGGCASWELAQKVVRAFNQLSGMHIRVDDIRFSPLNAFNVLSVNTASAVDENRTIGGNARIRLYPQTSQH